MAKWCSDTYLDVFLQGIDDSTLLTVCSAQPTTYAEASSTYKLADVVMTAGAGNGDYTLANGDASGRKLTVLQQTNMDIDSSGTATHVGMDAHANEADDRHRSAVCPVQPARERRPYRRRRSS